MTTQSSGILSPRDLGLPEKFKDWRPGQWAGIDTAITTERRFVAMCDPTGSGKSVKCVAIAILGGGRALYLTGTKSLQDQLHEFSECGMADMRGRQNYHCVQGSKLTCTDGRILECREAGCPYLADRNDFLSAKLGSTNYSYYFSSILHSEGVGDVDTLILDEAHSVVQELSKAVEIRLNHHSNSYLYEALSPPPTSSHIAELRTWAKYLLPRAQSYLRKLKSDGNTKWLSLTDSFCKTLERVSNVAEDWILDNTNPAETVLSPVWPTDFANTILFRDIPHIILVSATIVPKTLALLGIKEEESLFLSQDHTFDPNRCPVYLFGACKVDYKMSQGQFKETIARMDKIISRRLDRKGIIHCTSYKYQKEILEESEHRDIMIAPGSARDFQEEMARFLASPAPSIFLTPSATTGYDFAGDKCEYQILLKVPFIDARSPVMKARSEQDKEYLPYLVAQTLVQTVGRGMRSQTDRCESFLLDRHANWFLRSSDKGGFRHLVPSWFMRQVRWPDGLPTTPPKL